MGAKLIAPRASIVVSTDSMITGPARPEVGRRRGLGGRGARVDPDLFSPPLAPQGGEVDRPAGVHRGEHGLDDPRTSATGGGAAGGFGSWGGAALAPPTLSARLGRFSIRPATPCRKRSTRT